jgi:hypothetical protein
MLGTASFESGLWHHLQQVRTFLRICPEPLGHELMISFWRCPGGYGCASSLSSSYCQVLCGGRTRISFTGSICSHFSAKASN